MDTVLIRIPQDSLSEVDITHTTTMTQSPYPFSQATLPSAGAQTLIPGLPNDVGSLVLSFVPYCHHSRLKSICRLWRVFFSSKTLISLRRRNPKSLSHLLCIFPQDPSIASPYLFDPQSLAWCPLPRLSPNPNGYGLCNFTSVSIGYHMYVLGGSHFDVRSFPINRPSSSSLMFRFDFLTKKWEHLAPMISPRGSFACTVVPDSDQILVAGGGSRHTLFEAAGSRMSSVERYDIGKNEWVALDGLPNLRAGCMGFLVGNGEQREFWVMGGYGESRTVLGVVPMDEYYRDAMVLELNGDDSYSGKWRQVSDMWKEGERKQLGKTVVMEDENGGLPQVFMLDGYNIFRYEIGLNRWEKESSIPKKAARGSSFGFIGVKGELHIMMQCPKKPEGTVLDLIYNPKKKTWRQLVTRPPFHSISPLDFKTAVLCNILL